MPPPRVIPAGTVFGELTVVATRQPGEDVRCRCACGNEVSVSIENIGHTKRCKSGIHLRGTANPKFRHGHTVGPQATATYHIWAQMVQRITNPSHPRYADYGGRGIDLDPRWLDFRAFVADVGERPAGLTLDRIDNDKGYWPDNCRWTTRSEQMKNRRWGGPTRGADGRWEAKHGTV